MPAPTPPETSFDRTQSGAHARAAGGHSSSRGCYLPAPLNTLPRVSSPSRPPRRLRGTSRCKTKASSAAADRLPRSLVAEHRAAASLHEAKRSALVPVRLRPVGDGVAHLARAPVLDGERELPLQANTFSACSPSGSRPPPAPASPCCRASSFTPPSAQAGEARSAPPDLHSHMNVLIFPAAGESCGPCFYRASRRGGLFRSSPRPAGSSRCVAPRRAGRGAVGAAEGRQPDFAEVAPLRQAGL